MKLDQRTIQVLKNFSSINNSILFRPGNVLKTVATTKTILAQATLEQEFPSTFAIYELNKFLSVLSLFDDPELDIQEKFMTIKSGKKRVKYVFADQNTIVAPDESKQIKFPKSIVNFELTSQMLTDLNKALGVLRHPEIAISGDGANIHIKTVNSKDPTSDDFSIEVGETDNTFNFVIKADNIKLLNDDYTVDISMGISRFKSKDLEYYIAVESNSKFES